MADDVVILLSSDDSCDNAFVTPHPRTASDDGIDAGSPSPAKTRQPGSRPDDLPQHCLPAASPAIRQHHSQHIDIIEIDDTPAPVSRANHACSRPSAASRSGFAGFSSDDLASSPFPGDTTPSARLLPPRPTVTAHRSPLQGSIRAKAARAAVQRLQSSLASTDGHTPHNGCEVEDDGVNDYEIDDLERDRPAKRPRLSPAAVAVAPAARPPSPINGRAAANLHRPDYEAPPSHLSPVALRTQRLSQFMDDFDDEDDMVDLPPIVQPTQPVRAPQKQQTTTQSKNTECIDLLSSSESDSEANRTRSTTGPLPSDSDFVDIDDLLMQPSHQAPKQQQQQQQQQQSQPKLPQSQPVQHKRQTSDEILLLSSSSVVSPRSFSEGHALAFSDEEDDEDAIAAETFLADWRKAHPEVATKAKPTTAPTRRRSSFDKGVAALSAPRPRKKQQPVDEEKRREMAAEKEQRLRNKEAERERRAKEKEVDRERRKIASDLAKEKKAKERAEAAAFNDANKSRVDKAVATPEMIVRLPTSMPEATREKAEEMLTDAKATFEPWTSTPIDNVVTWRRKLSNEYKPELGHWVPVPTRVEDETHALVVLRAEEFVQLIMAGQSGDPDVRHAAGGHDLNSHVAAMKRAFAGYTIVYLVEGLHAWRNKNRTIRNRQFVAAVRGDGSTATTGSAGQDGASSSATTGAAPPTRPSQRLGRRGQKQAPQHLDEALVDDALLDLQIEHNNGGDGDGSVLVHETVNALDTARWVRVFTEQIAVGRYRQHREALYAAAASFCMDSGQIATGDDPQDLYALILQQVARVTEPVALGVAARFDNIPRLVQGFQEEGPLALEAVLKSRNRNGALSDRTIGPALSRRLHKVFLGRDAASTDV
ncbi:hypothetical protein SBRCBS47491_004741 [Sporothrix bragantina]|uniref:ERCC4 domain-containing protein n=1 Tax=Sporothrix bragantina TaxID=671064 RepID=A0ABP0BS94_9PEZI